MLESKAFDSSREYEKVMNDFITKLAIEKKKVDFSKLWLICLNYSNRTSNKISEYSFNVGMGMNIRAEWKLVYKG